MFFIVFKIYRYKLKEAVKHLTGLIQETKDTITYLESVETALNHASISDIEDIREELVETGFVKRRTRDKGHNAKTRTILGFRWQNDYHGWTQQSAK